MKFNWITISWLRLRNLSVLRCTVTVLMLVVAVVDTFFAWPWSSLVIIGYHLFLDNDHHHSGHWSTCSDPPPVPDMLIV